MTNKKSTKRALLLSVLSLVLCFSMLVGTTFAWFTDSVTSANNIIKSGNLDVTLEYYNGTAWVDVEGSSEILDATALWEPGYTEVVYFRIKNAGSLALKYQFGVNIVSEDAGVNMAGESFKLSDYIYFDVFEDVNGETAAFADRTAAMANTTETTKISDGYSKADVLLANSDYKYLAMVVYMPTTVGNEANAKTGAAQPKINLGINVVATQYTAEEDAFGSDYDKDANFVSAPVTLPTEDVTEPVSVFAGDAKVVIPADVVNALPAEVTSIALTYTTPKVDAANGVVSFDSVELVDQNGEKIDLTNNTAPIAVTLPAQETIPANTPVVVMHDGVAVASATVAADGSISYTANHFCEVTVVTATKVATADELVAAVAEGGNIVFADDITLSEILVINNDNTAIYGMGYKLTSTAARAINVSGANGVTINGLTIVASGERAINVIQNATNVTIVGVTATAENYTVNVASSAPNAVVAIKNSTLNGLCTVNVSAEGSKVTVDNSTVNCNDNNTTEGEAYAALSLNREATGGSIIATNTIVNVAEESDSLKGRNSATDGTVTINGSTDDVAVSVAVITYPGQPYYYSFLTLESAIEFAKETDTITLIRDIALDKAITLDGDVKLDLNGHTISGVCNASQGYLIGVNNGVTFTVSDSSEEQTGKITYASGSSNVGWTIKVDGNLVLNSGTIELTGDWSIGYAIDLRPNSWGTEFTQASTVTINGGKLVSSDGGIRVASSSYEKHTKVAASLVMNGGEIVAAFDGIFVQQSDAIYDVLSVTLNNAKVTAALYPVRFYGPNATSVVGGVEKPMTFTLNNTELVLDGEVNANATWYVNAKIALGGGMNAEILEKYTTIVE